MATEKVEPFKSVGEFLVALVLGSFVMLGILSRTGCFDGYKAGSDVREKAEEAFRLLSTIGNDDIDVGKALAAFNESYKRNESKMSFESRKSAREADEAVASYNSYLFNSLVERDAGRSLNAAQLERGT